MMIGISERSALYQPVVFYETVTISKGVIDDYRFEDVDGDGFHQILTAFDDGQFGFEVHQFIVALIAIEHIDFTDPWLGIRTVSHEVIDKRAATWHMN